MDDDPSNLLQSITLKVLRAYYFCICIDCFYNLRFYKHRFYRHSLCRSSLYQPRCNTQSTLAHQTEKVHYRLAMY